MASRSRSRSPIKRSSSVAGSGRASPALSSTSGTEYKKYQLLINSIPHSWNYQQVSGYIRKHTFQVDKAIGEKIGYISMMPNPQYPDSQQAIITFKNETSRTLAFERLKASPEKVEGKKLFVKKIDTKSKNFLLKQKFVPNNARAQGPNNPFRYVTPHIVDCDGDENETYGLSASYLDDMGMTTRPLTRWVFVRGLPEEYNNETKLREAFGKAGFIVSASIIESKSGNSYNARIEYDHPVEAVQAVSMYNKREVLGQIISCEMDFWKKKDFIDGVAQGPGLGPEGRPMRGIRTSVECKKAKNEFMQEIAKINNSLDELKAQVTTLYMEVENVKSEKKAALAVQNTPSQNISNPLAALGNILSNQLQPMLLQGLMQQSTGNDVNPLGSLLQTLTGGNMNLSNLLQQAQSGANMLSVSNFQSGPDNMQGGPNNMNSGPNNMQSGPNNMQAGPSNMQSGPNNIQAGLNNMQSGPNNMQSGPSNMQGGPNNMQGGGPSNMQGGPNNMQGGGSSNMQGGPNNMLGGGPSNMQGGPNNMQGGGPSNMQGGPNNMQGGGSSYLQGGPNNMQMQNSYDSFGNMQSGPTNQGNPNSFNETNNPGFNMPNQQNNFGNLQSNYEQTNQMRQNKHKLMKCFKCGVMGHKSNLCTAKLSTKKNLQTMERKGFELKLCNNCSKPGHLAHECWSKTNKGPNQNQNNNQQSGGMGNSTVLLFKNLPPAVTYQVLQGKMLEVGKVKMVEMTGPGRALVSFCYDQDSDKCIRLFNESKVDGQTILVKRV